MPLTLKGKRDVLKKAKRLFFLLNKVIKKSRRSGIQVVGFGITDFRPREYDLATAHAVATV